jgi:hypothetical protein
MVVVTPSYAPDLELFEDLHRSVLRWFPADARHVVVVDDSDRGLFGRFAGPQCEVLGVSDVLPGSIRSLPFTKYWINMRRPVPPLRGWIVQQLVKLAVARESAERIIVLADSDLVFVRPVTAATFAPDGRVRLYRSDGGIDDTLPRHIRWHEAAARMLGLPAPGSPPLDDYVASLNSWDGDVVGRSLARVEDVTGSRWLDVIGKELHFSEWTLYGLYADRYEHAKHVALSDASLCHSYWDNVPLDTEQAIDFVSSVGADDVAYMIGAKSHTPLSVRRAAEAALSGG